jgi:class 3 adenylate cyclase/tetratricopeptide (TPR) repeat protein
VTDLRQWLAGKGLERYVDVLLAHDIDLDIARGLTESDLALAGLPLGARKRLLQAFSTLDAEPASLRNFHTVEDLPPEAEAERRQLAVLFCDIVGSTTLAEKLDVEDLRAVLLQFQTICAEVVQRYQGHIGLFIGDGMTAYFGYPQATEDFAQRAIGAGLQILKDIRLQERPIELRCGIHVGPVVVGDMGAGDKRMRDGLVGEVPNVAARLQSIAPPGSLVISEAAEKIINGYFDVEPMGEQMLKGVGAPIRVYRVAGSRIISSRFEGQNDQSLTRFVGRETEFAFLLKRWNDAKEGDDQSIVLVGEAGIGKSRLLERLREHVRCEMGHEIALFCSPLHETSALWPVEQYLRRTLSLDQPPEKSRSQITTYVRELEIDNQSEAEAELAALLIGHEEKSAALDPAGSRRILFTALTQILLATVNDVATLIVLEDAHWIDASTSELIGRVLLKMRGRPVLFLITARPEFRPGWAGAKLVTLPLTRLSRREAEEMISSVAPSGIPPAILMRLAKKAEGVPLFIEELTKSVVDSKVELATTSQIELPASLEAALHTRLDRLAPIRQIVQIAALLGRVFQEDLLIAASHRSPTEVRRALTDLISAELIYLLPGETANFEFKHALIQEAATSTMLRNQKAQLHRMIASALIGLRPQLIKQSPEQLAYHLMEAGSFTEALDHWETAGALARSRAAANEAISHYRKAIECAKDTQDTSRDQERIAELHIALANALMQAEGYRPKGLQTILKRAEELSARSGSERSNCKMLLTFSPYFFATGRNDEYIRRCTGPLSTFSREANHLHSGLLVTTGIAHFNRAEFRSAIDALTAALHVIDQLKESESFLIGGASPAIAVRQYLIRSLLIVGEFDRSLIDDALQWMLRRNLNPFDRAWALIAAGYAHLAFGAFESLSHVAAELIHIGEKYGYAPRKANGLIFRGYCESSMGQPDLAIADFRQGYEIWRGEGVVFHTPERACALCEALINSGRLEDAEQYLNELDMLVTDTDEASWQSECIRLRGLIALRRDENDDAEASFLRAISLADRQCAYLFEVRAARQLAEMLANTPRKIQGCRQLEGALNRIPEESPLADVRSARQFGSG